MGFTKCFLNIIQLQIFDIFKRKARQQAINTCMFLEYFLIYNTTQIGRELSNRHICAS
jgi:hypothetical protein